MRTACRKLTLDAIASPSTPLRDRELASWILSLPPWIASGLDGSQVANDTGETSSSAPKVTAESCFWTTKDRARFRGGLNLYAYCYGDPVNLIDSTGYGPRGAAVGATVGAGIGAFYGFQWGAAGGVLATAETGPGAIGGGAAGGIGGAVAGAGIGGFFGGVAGSGIEDALGWISDYASKKSVTSKPKGCPTGTVPISGTKWSEHHQPIKRALGIPNDGWTGISPEGNVISADGDGNAVDNGPAEDYIP